LRTKFRARRRITFGIRINQDLTATSSTAWFSMLGVTVLSTFQVQIDPVNQGHAPTAALEGDV
jgi:hypothetical protein